jgi:glycosyltransferase involved in cell wall biosynthesis
MSIRLSVIIPAYNASATLPRCLDALQRQTDDQTEIILVDDCSSDATPAIAAASGIRVVRTPERSGPAAARNLGAREATGEILFFIDSDVTIGADSIRLVKEVLDENLQIAAVFGSYDDQPAEKNFLSQYKNLLHHFVHQKCDVNAATFWAGCGAIRKKIFEEIGGFNAQMYPHPSIEDIELGVRLRKNNHLILLKKELQGKHLKIWNPLSLLKADIFYRAYPWSRLIAETGDVPNRLNLQISHRVSAFFSILFFLLLAFAAVLQSALPAMAAATSLAIIVFLNREFYAFLLQRRGILFLLGSIFWHMLYYSYSAIIFVYCWIRFRAWNSGARTPLTVKVKLAPHEKS